MKIPEKFKDLLLKPEHELTYELRDFESKIYYYKIIKDSEKEEYYKNLIETYNEFLSFWIIIQRFALVKK